jgi:hypothetical protein
MPYLVQMKIVAQDNPARFDFAAKSGSCANRIPLVATYSLLNPIYRA